ncbi:Guanine nucleotide-binding protein, beta subunit [Trema orientale]|uniref:Guanine nucleotide-binding protein, beta subunit n=1 Tax=Trema orientale TaxID=63057 RepID=A0A2P5EX21_TREOI|nr:Guanine nucleotide-binding protein, beta subunit [Trema orientale]
MGDIKHRYGGIDYLQGILDFHVCQGVLAAADNRKVKFWDVKSNRMLESVSIHILPVRPINPITIEWTFLAVSTQKGFLILANAETQQLTSEDIGYQTLHDDHGARPSVSTVWMNNRQSKKWT